ncbi:hypothetical protein BDW74DRAFT_158857 [Aspergillus multicolor]|uniref:uncharacterized protein n=1 Tax=Aspergillus multicolor TaxID=41759 RepID=UPI003CCD6EE0
MGWSKDDADPAPWWTNGAGYCRGVTSTGLREGFRPKITKILLRKPRNRGVIRYLVLFEDCRSGP